MHSTKLTIFNLCNPCDACQPTTSLCCGYGHYFWKPLSLQISSTWYRKERKRCVENIVWLLNNSLYYIIVVQNLDVKKERRRNLIPAKIGIYAIFILIFFVLFHYITYSIEMNNGHRALLHAIASDAYYCIVAPTIVLYSIPSVVRNIKAKYLNIVS